MQRGCADSSQSSYLSTGSGSRLKKTTLEERGPRQRGTHAYLTDLARRPSRGQLPCWLRKAYKLRGLEWKPFGSSEKSKKDRFSRKHLQFIHKTPSMSSTFLFGSAGIILRMICFQSGRRPKREICRPVGSPCARTEKKRSRRQHVHRGMLVI